MQAVAHGWKPDRIEGPPVSVAKEFVEADAAEGGYMDNGYQFGGLTGYAPPGRAEAGPPGGPRRMDPRMAQAMMGRQRGKRGGRGFPGRGGGIPPHVRARMMRGRGLPQGGFGKSVGLARPQGGLEKAVGLARPPQQGGLPKPVGLGGRGRVQAGGPGGQVPGREFIGPGASATPGVPPNLRGYLQKMRSAQRGAGQSRIGMGDQQGAMARARQKQTGRPPISRRSAFPGRAR